jgi:GT2 family glycosyltransferase
MEKNIKSVLFVCVNYNTNELLNNYIKSIAKAKSLLNYPLRIDILIGDNSEIFDPVRNNLNKDISVFHINNKNNLGYIGGVTRAIKESNIDLNSYDYVIISNVDLTISDTFFKKMVSLKIGSEIGWIAPCIFSEKEKRDRNPKIIKRPSVGKMKTIALMYRFPLIHYIYSNTIYKNSDKNSTNFSNNNIYAGHGSFMIFTNSFIKKNLNFRFPGFLFGEEIFFAELVRMSKLKTIYIPELIVNDIDHASTNKLKKAIFYKINYQSIKIITEKFFYE